ncbi:MAG: chromosome segregation protein SMC, partial [Clostridia bacterium]|nr:chromosome segregation protein SMC [Clostridia bacterium]
TEDKLTEEEKRAKTLAEELDALKAETVELQEKLLNFDDNNETQNDRIEELKQEISVAFERVSDCKIALSNLELLERNVDERVSELKRSLADREKELKEQEEKGGDLTAEHSRKEEMLKGLEEKLSALKERELKIQEQLDRQTAKTDELTKTHHQKTTRLHLLSEMEQNFEGYYKSVREIMKQSENGMLKNAGIHGPVSKLISVDKRYAEAVGSALGGALQNLVVDTEEDAKEAIRCLKQTNAGRATFMPISAISGSAMDVSRVEKEAGYIGLASALVQYDAKYEGIVQNLLGKTVVFENVDQAILVSRKFKQSLRIVTLDGEIFYPGGSLSGGSQQKGSQLLSRDQEIRDLQKALLQLEKDIKTEERAKTALEAEFLELAQEQENINQVYTENKEVLLLLIRDREHHDLLLSTLKTAIADLEREITETRKESESFESRRKEAADKLAEAEEEIRIKRQEVNALEEVYEQFANRKQKISDQLLENGFRITAKEQEIQQNKDKIQSLHQEIEQGETHIKLRRDEIAEITKTNDEHQSVIGGKELQNKETELKIKEFKVKIESITKERQESEQQLRALQGDAKNTRETVYQLKTEEGRLTAQREKLENESEQAIARLWDEYELTYSEAEAMKQDLGSVTEVNKQISSLKNQIRNLGNVNVDAIEELQAVSERFTFLTGQRDDLNKAKRDLLKIIDEMQSIMKKQFKEEFDKINQYFKSTFSELFGGGRADLSLEDETNILDCGIHINVQPPGKKLQSLSLLSGGERALSAIALLFAILRIKPTPFCFLDEIEAALDENNVYRYAEFIKRFSRKTQFILVTHRRGTMESADMIYGVTMQEKGVSKLLPLNLDEIDIQ